MKLDSEVILDLCSSPNNIWVTRARRVEWAGHAAGMEGDVSRLF